VNQKNTPKPAPKPSKADLDNRSRQLNDQHDTYWTSRGLPEKPAQGETPPPPAEPKQR